MLGIKLDIVLHKSHISCMCECARGNKCVNAFCILSLQSGVVMFDGGACSHIVCEFVSASTAKLWRLTLALNLWRRYLFSWCSTNWCSVFAVSLRLFSWRYISLSKYSLSFINTSALQTSQHAQCTMYKRAKITAFSHASLACQLQGNSFVKREMNQ